MCRMQLSYPNRFPQSTVLHTPQQGHARACQHQELLMGVAWMDDHNGRTSPSIWQFSVVILGLFHTAFTGSVHCSDACLLCLVCRAPGKCVCLDQVCPYTLLARLSPVRSVPATAPVCHFKHMRTHRDLRGHDSRSCRPLAASCFVSTRCAFPGEGEWTNQVCLALLIQLICHKWAEHFCILSQVWMCFCGRNSAENLMTNSHDFAQCHCTINSFNLTVFSWKAVWLLANLNQWALKKYCCILDLRAKAWKQSHQ